MEKIERRIARAAAAMLLATAAMACAGPAPAPGAVATPAPNAVDLESPVPGTIGVAVKADGKRIVVADIGEAARSAGVQVGDVVIAYDGVKVSGVRQFERLVLETPPGSRASLQVTRDGTLRVIDLPVRQIVTASRG